MKLTVYFFDNHEVTALGNKRAGIALGFLIPLDLLFLYMTNTSCEFQSMKKLVLTYIITWFFIISILDGVTSPKSPEEAALYGALVGALVYCILNSWLWGTGKYVTTVAIRNTIVQICIVILVSVITYYISEKNELLNNN